MNTINQTQHFWASLLLGLIALQVAACQSTPPVYVGCYFNPETPTSYSGPDFQQRGDVARDTNGLANCAAATITETFFGINDGGASINAFYCWDIYDSILTDGQRAPDANCTSAYACASGDYLCGKNNKAVSGINPNRYTAVYSRVPLAPPTTAPVPTPVPTTVAPTTASPTTSSVGKTCNGASGQCGTGTFCNGLFCNMVAGLALQANNYATVSYIATCNALPAVQYGIYTVSSSGGPQQLTASLAYNASYVRRVVASTNQGVFYDESHPDGTRHLFVVNAPSAVSATGLQTQEILFPLASYQGFAEFDIAANNIYTCEYLNGNFVIGQYSNAADTSSIVSTPVSLSATPLRLKTVYNLGSNRCGTIRRGVADNSLYISYNIGSQTRISQGDIGCTDCTLSTQAFLTVSSTVVDYDVSNNFLFYGTSSGLFRFNITGTTAPTKFYSGVIEGIDAGPSNSGAGFMTTNLEVYSFPIQIAPSSFYVSKLRTGTSTCVKSS